MYRKSVRSHIIPLVKPDGTLKTPVYIEVLKGRFENSIGRIERVTIVPNVYNRQMDAYYIHVIFEPGGRAYKLDAADSYNPDVWLAQDGITDEHLQRVDQKDNKKIPKLTDRYGTEVTVGLLMVVHTHEGLKIGTVKSITPKGTIRFRDFDDSKAEFSKQLWVGGGDSAEIMALQKDFMDQMLLRKLARR